MNPSPGRRGSSAIRPAGAKERRVGRALLLSSWLALTNAQLLQSQADYATPILAGISNHGRNQREPYVTAGDRAYLIGTQDGDFPAMGQHVPGEMGGLGLHPLT